MPHANGTVSCWGAGHYGQLGVKDPPDRCTSSSARSEHRCARAPVAVEGVTEAIAISAGSDETCVVTRGGEVHCWGLPFGLVPAPNGRCDIGASHEVDCLPLPQHLRDRFGR